MATRPLTIRVPDALLLSLKAEHRRTYTQHGLAFQTWLRAIWSAFLKQGE